MEKHTYSTDLSQKIFSLPFAEGESPFDLSEEEKKLSPDDWAWLFLRLNPLYQRDYALWQNQAAGRDEMPARYRPNGAVVPLAPGAPATPVPAELRNLDSRYFALHGDPLGGRLDDWTYESETLGAYLDQHPEIDLKAIRIREFDAPGDYGIGAWLDPAALHPQNLPRPPAASRGSWFYHVNEPIWEVHPDRVMQAKLLLHELPDGQRIAFGRDHYARRRDVRQIDESHQVESKDNPEQQQHRSMHLLPSSTSRELATTQLRFLVCLDGYVRPQVAVAFELAAEFRQLHKEHDPGFETGSALALPIKIGHPQTLTERPTGLFAGLSGAAVRTRKHWCAVTIDVVGPLGGQQEAIEAALLKKQEALGDALAFPVRMRSPREKDPLNNPLKRALCAVELRQHGDDQRKGRPSMSYGRINHALYCNDQHDYYLVRDRLVPPNVKLNKGGIPELGKPNTVVTSLELGQGMALGWYELLASRKF